MKRPSFAAWYFNQGIHELLEMWKNSIELLLRFFSMEEMIRTLLSPWHRDVHVQTWRGWNPEKSLELIFENVISRCIGAVVRIIMIAVGAAFVAAALVTGLAVAVFWIVFPLLLVAGIIAAFGGAVPFSLVIASLASWVVVSIGSYSSSVAKPMQLMGSDELVKQAVFERISGRFGISGKRFPKNVLEDDGELTDFLKLHGLTRKDYAKILQWELGRAQQRRQKKKFWLRENLDMVVPLGMQWRYGYTINLDRYCTDLSRFDSSEYAESELVGRIEEMEVLKLVMQRPDQNCALIVGQTGVGKNTLIHSLAREIRRGKGKGNLKNVRIMMLDLGRAISETINKGEDVEQFVRILLSEAAFAGNVVLVVPQLENYLGKNSSAFHPDISVVLSEFLHLPSLRIIATSEPSGYHQLVEKNHQIVKYFEVIEMREASEDEALEILLMQLEKYERSRVLFSFGSLKAIVRDSGRHNWEFPLPERALDLAMDVFTFWEKKSDEQFVTEKTVADYLSLKTGSMHGEITDDERGKLLNLEEELHRQVIGQDEAVGQVAQSLRRSRSGIGDSKKPIGSFLFLGPTGVGKTETAKALAKTYFGSEDKMIRLDMSEFQSPGSIDRLLGSSQLDQPGRLVTKIKDNPYSLLLLDEIEKAYPDILDIFLQILDEGFVTDAFGEKINFRNTFIIATSNAGAALIKDMVEQGARPEDIKKAVIDYAIEKNIFRTEFLNRFEEVVFFRPLGSMELVSVVRLQLQKVARRLLEEKNIEIEVDDGMVGKIIEKGYDPIFGARSLNRYIEDSVEDVIAKKIISGEVQKGEKITISL
jgi:ATP-dependent Clp protease ATP-binding subunit ClpC